MRCHPVKASYNVSTDLMLVLGPKQPPAVEPGAWTQCMSHLSLFASLSLSHRTYAKYSVGCPRGSMPSQISRRLPARLAPRCPMLVQLLRQQRWQAAPQHPTLPLLLCKWRADAMQETRSTYGWPQLRVVPLMPDCLSTAWIRPRNWTSCSSIICAVSDSTHRAVVCHLGLVECL